MVVGTFEDEEPLDVLPHPRQRLGYELALGFGRHV